MKINLIQAPGTVKAAKKMLEDLCFGKNLIQGSCTWLKYLLAASKGKLRSVKFKGSTDRARGFNNRIPKVAK